MSRRIPKSLHTITAFVQLAVWLIENDCEQVKPGRAVKQAAAILGYGIENDPDDLIAKAIKAVGEQLERAK
jgi:hypothetical protein